MNLKELMEYLRTHEMDVQSARAMFIFAEKVFRAYAESDVLHGVTFSPVVFLFSKERFYQLIPRWVLDEVARKVYQDFLKDKDSLDKLIADHRSYEFLMDELWGKIRSRLELAEVEELKGYYSEMSFLAERWWHYAAIGEDKGGLVERELAPRLAERQRISKAEALGVIGVLSHPDEAALFTRERKDFFELCRLKLENDLSFNDRADEFAGEYFWKDTDFYERRAVDAKSVMTDVDKEIENKDLAEIKKELEEMDTEAEVNENRKKELRKKYKLGPEDEKIIEFALKMTQWQDFRKLGMVKHLYYVFYLLEVMARKLGTSYDNIVYATGQEFEDLSAGQGKINQADIERRLAGTAFVFVKDEGMIELGQEAYREIMAFISESGAEEGLSGTVASMGKGESKKVEGIVRVVINPLREEFNEGEILVTSMTRVEFVPLIRRAKAIITDEGGITTHAAIVSRELGVPCIIGTRRATRVLKNGDRVELDMESGEIRII